MTIRFDPRALAELDDAVAFYNQRRPGLGLELNDEVEAAMRRIAEHPEAWRDMGDGVRRCILHRFPYALLFRRVGADIEIATLMHTSRRPGYWRDRLDR